MKEKNKITDINNYFEKSSEDFFPDLTPLIDVVFILIVFFLLTSSLTREKTLSIDIPESSTGEISQTENILIEIDKGNNIFYQNVKTDFIQMEFILKEKQRLNAGSLQLPSIIIRSDKETNFGTIIKLMDIIKNSGYDSASFAVTEKQ